MKENFYTYIGQIDYPDQQEIFSAPEVLDYYNYIVNTKQADNALEEAAARLADLPVCAACSLALVCGAWVENGGSPVVAFDGLMLLLKRVLQDISRYAGQLPDEEEEESDAQKDSWDSVQLKVEQENELVAKLSAALDLLVLPLMAMLMRSVSNRIKYREDALAVHELFYHIYESDSLEFDNLHFLRYAYDLSDIESLFVVFPKQKVGVEVSVHAVNNNFHLFTLLQYLVAEEGAALGLPSGEGQQENEADFHTAAFDWLSSHAYQDGQVTERMALAWGEAAVSDNPLKDGRYVLIADERTMARSWDASFCTVWHDQQDAYVHFKRMLTSAEIEQCLR